jgi:hypothetical protein
MCCNHAKVVKLGYLQASGQKCIFLVNFHKSPDFCNLHWHGAHSWAMARRESHKRQKSNQENSGIKTGKKRCLQVNSSTKGSAAQWGSWESHRQGPCRKQARHQHCAQGQGMGVRTRMSQADSKWCQQSSHGLEEQLTEKPRKEPKPSEVRQDASQCIHPS